jgi:beta-ribofuranosylaminobenzene 5'-phosphate synthase
MEVCVTSYARIHLGFYTYPPNPNPWRGAGIYLSKPSLTVCAGDYAGLRVPGCFEEEQVSKIAKIAGRDSGIRVYGCIPPHRGLGSSTQLYLSTAMAVSLYTTGRFEWETAVYRLERYVMSRVGALLFKYGGFVVDGSILRGKPLLKPLYTGKLPEDWRIVIVDPGETSGPRESLEYSIWKRLPQAPPLLEKKALEAILKMKKAVLENDIEGFFNASILIDSTTGKYFSRLTRNPSGPRRCLKALLYARDNGVHLMQSSWGPILYTFTNSGEERSVTRIIKEAFDMENCQIRFVEVVSPRNQGAEFIIAT